MPHTYDDYVIFKNILPTITLRTEDPLINEHVWSAAAKHVDAECDVGATFSNKLNAHLKHDAANSFWIHLAI